MTVRRLDGILIARLTGKVSRADYDRWMDEVERLTGENGPMHILVELADFEGWDMTGSSWDGTPFAREFFDNVRRIAFLGDKAWRNWMQGFCKPFRQAEIRFFAPNEAPEAGAWLGAADLLPSRRDD